MSNTRWIKLVFSSVMLVLVCFGGPVFGAPVPGQEPRGQGAQASPSLPDVQKSSPAGACCSITAIDSAKHLVTAKETATDRAFQFTVPDPRLLGTLRIGHPVYANFQTKQVSLDGKTTCCTIVSISAPLNRAQQPIQKQGAQPSGNTSPLFNMTLNQSMVTGGASVDGTVSHALGGSISLSSSNPSVAQVSAQTYVGSNTTTFKVTTYPVVRAVPVTISVSYGVLTKTAMLTVQPPSLDMVTVLGPDPSAVSSYHQFSTYGLVYLTGPAPSAGIKVALSSSNPLAAVPTGVLVPVGKMSERFPVTISPVAGPTNIFFTITASFAGVTKTSIPVLIYFPPLDVPADLTLSPTSVKGGTTVIGTVTLNGNFASRTFTLSSSNPSVAAVPMSVAVAPSASTATFVVTTNPVAQKTPVTISAVIGNYTKTAILEVLHH